MRATSFGMVELGVLAAVIDGGHANYGGAIFFSNGTLSMNGTIQNAYADENGGGIFLQQNTQLKLGNDSTIIRNHAGTAGGGVFFQHQSDVVSGEFNGHDLKATGAPFSSDNTSGDWTWTWSKTAGWVNKQATDLESGNTPSDIYVEPRH